MRPVRISIIGIDGSGKSTTTLRAIHSLSQQYSICKTGRGPFFIRNGKASYCFPAVSNCFEKLFKKVDATKKREWIGLTRVLFVLFQGWLEPHMIKRYQPELVMGTRCMIIDSSIYSDFYYPWISRKMTTGRKLRFAQLFSRLPFRDLYFFLDTPIPTAMARIYKRISDDHPEMTYGRDYWLHLHEHEAFLRVLDKKFRETLQMVKVKTPLKLVEIDTATQNEEEVSRLVFEYSTDFSKGH